MVTPTKLTPKRRVERAFSYPQPPLSPPLLIKTNAASSSARVDKLVFLDGKVSRKVAFAIRDCSPAEVHAEFGIPPDEVLSLLNGLYLTHDRTLVVTSDEVDRRILYFGSPGGRPLAVGPNGYANWEYATPGSARRIRSDLVRVLLSHTAVLQLKGVLAPESFSGHVCKPTLKSLRWVEIDTCVGEVIPIPVPTPGIVVNWDVDCTRSPPQVGYYDDKHPQILVLDIAAQKSIPHAWFPDSRTPVVEHLVLIFTHWRIHARMSGDVYDSLALLIAFLVATGKRVTILDWDHVLPSVAHLQPDDLAPRTMSHLSQRIWTWLHRRFNNRFPTISSPELIEDLERWAFASALCGEPTTPSDHAPQLAHAALKNLCHLSNISREALLRAL